MVQEFHFLLKEAENDLDYPGLSLHLEVSQFKGDSARPAAGLRLQRSLPSLPHIMSMYSARSQSISAVGSPTWNRVSCQLCSRTARAREHALISGQAQRLAGQQLGIQALGCCPVFWQGRNGQ